MRIERTNNFNFEIAAWNGYAVAMSRQTSSNPARVFDDIIGVTLLVVALLLLVAQFSFDPQDISFNFIGSNRITHNLIGTIGAYLAWIVFLPLGLAAYLVPALLAAFGVAYLLDFLGYLRERLRWSLLWSVMLLISITGLFYMMDNAGLLGKLHESIGSQSAGGSLGWVTYGQTGHYQFGFCLLGRFGAVIVYSALCLISLLFLTNFRLGDWIRSFFQNKEPAEAGEPGSADEIALERRARELERQAKQLQEEVARSGLGADLQPVPEPTVRDLSVPQAKPARGKKATPPEPPKEPVLGRR